MNANTNVSSSTNVNVPRGYICFLTLALSVADMNHLRAVSLQKHDKFSSEHGDYGQRKFMSLDAVPAITC